MGHGDNMAGTIYTDADIAKMDAQASPTAAPTAGSTPKTYTDADIAQMDAQNGAVQKKPFYDALGANMTPEMKNAHPILAGTEQTAQDVATLGEKAANGLSLGLLDKGLNKAGIQPPNFDNTAPENKSGLNLGGDVANMAAGTKTLGVIGSKVVAPAAKAIAKAVPEGLKQSSYALMQSIVNQLPKEFKYGANAGRAMVKEGFSGDAAAIKEQSDNRLDEIKGQGDALASASNKPVNNSNAMKVIDDKIAELQSKSPRTSASTINKLMNSKKDLLGVVEDDKGNIINEGKDVSNMTTKDTLDLKRDFDDHTAWKGTAADDTVYNKTMQQARTQLKNNLNDAAPGMKEWNQRYADLRAAQQASGRSATYAEAGAGLKNMLNNVVRGTIGVTTLGAALHGNGELAGEIIAGWGAKEIMGNPMIKSKLAQAIYGLSEPDKMAIFKSAPWIRKTVNDAMENFRQKPNPRGEPVDSELVDNRPLGIGQYKPMVRNDRLISNVGNSDASVINQGGYVPPGLPNNVVGRSGVNPNTSMGGLPDPGNTAIRQPGFVPKGLPEPLSPTARVGVNPPGTALPSPKSVGRSPISMGTSYKPPETPPKYPKTDFGNQLKYQMQRKENVPLHPAEAGREELAKIYPAAEKGNPNLKSGDIDDFNNMKDWELSQNPGGWKSHGPQDELSFTKSPTGHSEAFKKVSNNSEKAGFDLLRRASSGEEMTNGDKLKIQMMLHDFRKNIKPKMDL